MRLIMLAAAVLVIASQAYAVDKPAVELAALEAIMSGTTEPDTRTKVTVTCFLTGERTSGMNKICFYDCLGSEAATTIGVVQLCPLTINR